MRLHSVTDPVSEISHPVTVALYDQDSPRLAECKASKIMVHDFVLITGANEN